MPLSLPVNDSSRVEARCMSRGARVAPFRIGRHRTALGIYVFFFSFFNFRFSF